MNGNPGPVRYVLYSHYFHCEDKDLKAYQRGKAVEDLEGVKFLLSHCGSLRELLTAPGHEGLLVLFLAPGYESFLNALAESKNVDDLLKKAGNKPEYKPLRYVKEVAIYVRSKLQDEGLEDRVRIVTCFDLQIILGRVNAIFAEKFHKYFVGRNRGMRYDAPKIVEAILRLRLLGNGIPILRVDRDVLFRRQNPHDSDMFKAIACAVRAHQLRLAKPTVSTFLFSASYDSKALLHRTKEMGLFEAWGRAFATRIYPALIANAKEINRIASKKRKRDRDLKWKDYVESHIDDDLARRYYGLKAAANGLEPDGINGLTSIGAHPLFSVISGALLCLSEGAILDLPPFSNMALNVMWIDDHLKYSLHRAMNHFTSGHTLEIERGLNDARLDVAVTKARPGESRLPQYVFGTYLPILLWGTIMDAWINQDSILKSRIATLRRLQRKRWYKARNTQQNAPLPRAMLEALREGTFRDKSEAELTNELERIAAKRIEEVRVLWTGLKSRKGTTFASYWAAGKVKRYFSAKCFQECENELWQGIAPGRPLDQPITCLDDLSAPMARAVGQLVSDTVAYIHWTLEWPRFVQIVRSIKRGDFVGDISWQKTKVN